jgi:hypothetical protein
MTLAQATPALGFFTANLLNGAKIVNILDYGGQFPQVSVL